MDNLVTSIVAFIGLNRESISREQGWVMLDMGRKIEQSLMLINMLKTMLVNKHDEQVVVIPNKAVTEQMGEFFVYVIEKDTAHQHKVTLGPVIGKNIVVLEGLKPGEVYAYDGLQKLRDNVPVLDASKMPPPDAAAKDPSKK